MNRPNTFIIGAPKCGTSALYAYLRAHPAVFMPHVKEPHYFCHDFPGLRRFPTERDYLSLFDGAQPEHRIIGEATTRYLYSQDAVPAILDFDPNAKLIVMLRNPIELVHSLHGQLLYQYTETERSFEVAWRLQAERRLGNEIPRSCPCVDELFYADVAMLGKQLEKLFRIVPPEQRHVIVYDDFREDLRQTYLDVLAYLELDDDGQTEFATVNPHKKYRSQLLAQLIVDPPYPLNRVKSGLKQTFGWTETRLGRWLYTKITVPTKQPPMSRRMRDELSEYFEDDVQLLERLLDRDLSHWCRQVSAAAA